MYTRGKYVASSSDSTLQHGSSLLTVNGTWEIPSYEKEKPRLFCCCIFWFAKFSAVADTHRILVLLPGNLAKMEQWCLLSSGVSLWSTVSLYCAHSRHFCKKSVFTLTTSSMTFYIVLLNNQNGCVSKTIILNAAFCRSSASLLLYDGWLSLAIFINLCERTRIECILLVLLWRAVTQPTELRDWNGSITKGEHIDVLAITAKGEWIPCCLVQTP